MKKRIVNAFRAIDDFVFSHVGPINILFVVRDSLGISCLLPLIREAMKRKDIKVRITEEIDFTGGYEWPIEGEIFELYSELYIAPSFSSSRKWHYVFTTGNSNLYFRRNHTKVYTQHSNGYGSLDKKFISNKYIKHLVEDNSHSIYFCNSIGDYLEMNNYALGTLAKQFFISGFPKLDKLFDDQEKKEKPLIIDSGLDFSIKTIVLASHWNPKSLFNAFDIKIINTLCRIKKYNVIATGHYKLWYEKPELYKEFEELAIKYDNFCFLPNVTDNTPLLNSADLFIGDNSSIFIEFCIMDKPILFFDHPDLEFMDPDVKTLYERASFSFSSLDNLDDLVQTAIHHPEEHKANRKKVVDNFLFRIGNSTKYTIDIIEKLGRISGPNSKEWHKVVELSKEEMSKLSNT